MRLPHAAPACPHSGSLLTPTCLAAPSSSGVNTTGGSRRALSTCLMDASTVFAADGSDTGATVLFGDDNHPARLGDDPETARAALEPLNAQAKL